MVIDSVDDLDEIDCRKFIPSSKYGRIIVTSTQSRTAAALRFKGIEITSIDEEAGCQMLLSKLGLDNYSSRGKHPIPVTRQQHSLGSAVLESAARIVKAMDGIPLFIEQAGAVLQDGVAIDELLTFCETEYRSIMEYTPEKGVSNYEKGQSVFKIIENLYKRLTRDCPDAANMLTLCSFFGSRAVPLQMITQFASLKLCEPKQSYCSSSFSSSRPENTLKNREWLLDLVKKDFNLRQAIMKLEKMCLAKVRKDGKGSITSWSVHNSICRWRLETLEPSERSEWALLTTYIVCASLQAIDSSPLSAIRYSVLVKHCQRILQTHLKREDTEAPNGTLCHQYGFIMGCFAEFYSQSECPAEAKGIFEAAIKYETVYQGSCWPQDLRSLHLIKGLAVSMWKQRNWERSREAFEFLSESSRNMLGDRAELTLWAAKQLRDIRNRKLVHAKHEQRALVASTAPKRGEHQGFRDGVASVTEPPPAYISAEIPDDERALLQLVEERSLLYGQLHTKTSAAIRGVAEFYEAKQRYSAAEGWFEQLWRSLVSMQQVTSVAALRALNDLIRVYKQSGRYIAGSPESMEQCCQQSLAGGAVITIQTEEGAAAMHYAILNCDKLVLRLLIEWGADVNARFENDATPLYLAALEDRSTHVHLLIQHGANPNALIGERTALMCAAYAGYKDVVQLLLDAGSEVNICQKSDTALMFAAEEGNISIIQLLLESGADTDIQDLEERTALHHAAYEGHEKVVQLLLDRGTDPGLQSSEGITALHEAAYKDHEKVIQLLLDRGADPDLQSSGWVTALHIAAYGGSEKALQLLLKTGADPDLQEGLGLTALHYALEGGHQDAMKVLLGHNASVHRMDVHGRAALHFALYGPASDTDRIVDQLWSLAVQPNDTDKHGRTLLHHAAAHGRVREVHRLLNDGFDPHLPDKDGWTPMHWAARNESIPIIEVLRQAGADKDTVSVDGWTPRAVAAYHQNDSVLASFQTHDSGRSMEQADADVILREESGHHHKGIFCDGCYLVCELSIEISSGKNPNSVGRTYMEFIIGGPIIELFLSTTVLSALAFQTVYILVRALSAGRSHREKRMEKMIEGHTHHIGMSDAS